MGGDKGEGEMSFIIYNHPYTHNTPLLTSSPPMGEETKVRVIPHLWGRKQKSGLFPTYGGGNKSRGLFPTYVGGINVGAVSSIKGEGALCVFPRVDMK